MNHGPALKLAVNISPPSGKASLYWTQIKGKGMEPRWILEVRMVVCDPVSACKAAYALPYEWYITFFLHHPHLCQVLWLGLTPQAPTFEGWPSDQNQLVETRSRHGSGRRNWPEPQLSTAIGLDL